MPPKQQKPELKPFSERLRAIIGNLGIEQKELANTADVQGATVSAYLKAESQPAMLILYKWSQEYRINLNWLVAGEGEMFLDKEQQGAEGPAKPKTQAGMEIQEIKTALEQIGASQDEIKQAILDHVRGGRAPLTKATGTDDDSR